MIFLVVITANPSVRPLDDTIRAIVRHQYSYIYAVNDGRLGRVSLLVSSTYTIIRPQDDSTISFHNLSEANVESYGHVKRKSHKHDNGPCHHRRIWCQTEPSRQLVTIDDISEKLKRCFSRGKILPSIGRNLSQLIRAMLSHCKRYKVLYDRLRILEDIRTFRAV